MEQTVVERREVERRMDWKTLLAYITGMVDQELLLRNAYLVTENRILRNQITGRVRLTDGERKALADIGQQLGKQALQEVAKIVKPDTILAWHRKFVAQKCGGSKHRKAPGRPTIDQEVEALVVRMARENRSWGYDRIVGALANLGHTISDQTVGNILRLILDSRVVIGQVWRNRLFLQAFHGGRDRCGIFGRSRLISST
jgi:Homeodomain-like domain